MILIVAYDLHQPGRDYAAVEALLKSARSWAHPQGSVWFLDTDRDPAWWRDQLMGRGDSNDEYFVARLQQHWGAFRLGERVNEWLQSPTRSW